MLLNEACNCHKSPLARLSKLLAIFILKVGCHFVQRALRIQPQYFRFAVLINGLNFLREINNIVPQASGDSFQVL